MDSKKVKCRRCGIEFGDFYGSKTRKLCILCDWDFMIWDAHQDLWRLSEARRATMFVKHSPPSRPKQITCDYVVKL